MKYKFEYTFDLITKNQVVSGNGCNYIRFRNVAAAEIADTATLDRAAPLIAGDEGVTLGSHNNPEGTIDQDFKIKFEGLGADKRILVTRMYVRTIKK